TWSIWHKRDSAASQSWGTEIQLTDTGVNYNPVALTVGSDVWLFWTSRRGDNWDIWHKRYSAASGSWGNDIQLTTDSGNDYGPAAVTVGGDVWLFWSSPRSGTWAIWHKRYSAASGSWGNDIQLTNTGRDDTPVVLTVGTNVWLFWMSQRGGNSNIWHKRYSAASQSWGTEIQLTDTGANGMLVALSVGADVWLFWVSRRDGDRDNNTIWHKRYSAASQSWGTEIQLTDTGVNYNPVALTVGSDVWLFWTSFRGDNWNIWHKQLLGFI
ncbi:MAG TPA: hypothetical protein VGD69_01775, partial [Herpetosiphonaceae bacterium]